MIRPLRGMILIYYITNITHIIHIDRVSHFKLLCKLHKRGVPLYLLILIKNSLRSQVMHVNWGKVISVGFNMGNGLRQGSVLSPKLFCVYSDKLNIMLNSSRIGCHVKNVPMNNFSYADDLVLLGPCASAINDLLIICNVFAQANYIIFSESKTECMCIKPSFMNILLPNVFLGSCILKYVTKFKYLGHIINSDFKDDEDIDKELRNMYARGNTIIKLFKQLNRHVKIRLFKSYCYPIYCSSLWSDFRLGSMNRIRTGYNKIFRSLLGIKLWNEDLNRIESMTRIYEEAGVRSLSDLYMFSADSCIKRVLDSGNSLIQCLVSSDACIHSKQWCQWGKMFNER